jgi:hypothetical protein
LWYSDSDLTAEKHALTSAMRALEVLRNIHQCLSGSRPAAIRMTKIVKQGNEARIKIISRKIER